MKTQSISRRALAAGLALAPVAGLPAVAIAKAHECDPIIAACAELQKLRRAEELAIEKVEAADKVFVSLRPKQCVEMDLGREFYSLEDFDTCVYEWGFHDNEHVIAKRAELVEILAAKELARKQSGLFDAEEALKDVNFRIFDLEDAILSMVPRSPAGAAALLQLVPLIFEDERDDAVALAFVAIARVADFIEGRETI